jgi:hypothetical protein
VLMWTVSCRPNRWRTCAPCAADRATTDRAPTIARYRDGTSRDPARPEPSRTGMREVRRRHGHGTGEHSCDRAAYELD